MKRIHIGQNNPNYKHGKYCINNTYYCLICKTKITYQINMSGLCKHCAWIRRFKNPKNHPMYGKSANWKRIKYQGIWMCSTWEVAYAKYLDKKKIKWLYESKTFDLGETTYTPDFYLPESDTYVEIKGWTRKDFIKKLRKFKKLYKHIKLKILDKNNKELVKILKKYNDR